MDEYYNINQKWIILSLIIMLSGGSLLAGVTPVYLQRANVLITLFV